MNRSEDEIVIKRSIGEVFDFIAGERNEPRYTPRLCRAELLAPEPIGAGAIPSGINNTRAHHSDGN